MEDYITTVKHTMRAYHAGRGTQVHQISKSGMSQVCSPKYTGRIKGLNPESVNLRNPGTKSAKAFLDLTPSIDSGAGSDTYFEARTVLWGQHSCIQSWQLATE